MGVENFIPGVPVAKELLSNRPIRMGLGAVAVGGVTVAGMAFGLTGVEATADLNKAHTTSNAKLVQYDETQNIAVATAYFDETLTATAIPYEVKSKPIDVIPNYKVNKELRGLGAEKFEVPLSALDWRVNASTGKTDITVHADKVISTVYWDGAGPEIRPFTVNKDGTGKNFGDRSGFKNSFLNAVGSNLKIVNLDTFKNTLDDLDAKVDHDMKLKGLEAFSECAPQLETRNRKAINKAIMAIVSLDQRDKVGEITYTGPLEWKTQLDPAKRVEGDTYSSNYPKKSSEYLIKNFKLDSMKCDVSKKEGAQ